MSTCISVHAAVAMLTAAILLGSLVAACSSPASSAGSECQAQGCPAAAPAAARLTGPAVSFKTDVVPVFQQSCGLSTSCHGQMSGGTAGLYLGGPLSVSPDPTGILAATVNVKSLELPTMNYVTPGDPANSYLMHKLDGDQCQFESQCSANPVPQCGVVMPADGTGCAMDSAVRDKVRGWIAQGAQND